MQWGQDKREEKAYTFCCLVSHKEGQRDLGYLLFIWGFYFYLLSFFPGKYQVLWFCFKFSNRQTKTSHIGHFTTLRNCWPGCGVWTLYQNRHSIPTDAKVLELKKKKKKGGGGGTSESVLSSLLWLPKKHSAKISMSVVCLDSCSGKLRQGSTITVLYRSLLWVQ